MSDIFINREISWLSFNYRVLQEAKSPDVPLYEKIKFLAIFSSNLDEFFRVRVAALRSLMQLSEKNISELRFNPLGLLEEIHYTVKAQQEEFGRIFREIIIPGLRKNGVYLIDNNEFTPEIQEAAEEYFFDNVEQHIHPMIIEKKKLVPFLQSGKLYLAVEIESGKKSKYAIIDIPSDVLPRFVEIHSDNGGRYVTFIDDIIRANLNSICRGYHISGAFSVKLTRDASLFIDDEFSGNLLSKIKKGLKKRNRGVPSRFLYDGKMPLKMLKYLKKSLDLSQNDLMEGGRYHNFNDFFTFPKYGGPELYDEPMPPVKNKRLQNSDSYYDEIDKSDVLLHFPYHDYGHVVEFFERAAKDPDVISIKATQYRVANDSKIVSALIDAARNGKEVLVFVEVKARFDEELNIHWAEEMERAGIKVYYSFPGLKVHAKISIITRQTPDSTAKYCYLSTGNFNEKTASVYTDFGLFTSDSRITEEIDNVFEFLSGHEIDYKFKYLLVARHKMRKRLMKYIDREIRLAQSGMEAKITLKLNSLEDRKMIKKLEEASRAGVKIDIVCRGICCLKPGVKGKTENIRIISIVDRFLEHSRIYIFNRNGDPVVYLSSADWMRRNLSRRIEVAFPIYDSELKKEIINFMKLQFADNQKARIIDPDNKNKYVSGGDGRIRTQYEMYRKIKANEEDKENN